jgi:hypothetical protein
MMVPILVAEAICAGNDPMMKNYLISSVMLVCGIGTLLACTIGVRLPMMLGASVIYLMPIYNLVSIPEWKCGTAPTNGTNDSLENMRNDGRAGERLREVRTIELRRSLVSFLRS